jgi:hypothetical protein
MPHTPRPFVLALGAGFAVEGLIGLIHPEAFRNLVVWLQSPPAWPASIVLRAVIGILFLSVAPSVRSANTVRAVGVLTLVGAVAGSILTHLHQAPHGPIWRLPALVLFGAGLAVIWGAGGSRPTT